MRTIKYKIWDEKLKKILPVIVINFEEGIVQAKHITSTGTSFNGTYEVRTLGLDSLMSFTGLLDKNGKEIYEGDLLKYWQPQNKYGKAYSNSFLVLVEWRKWHWSIRNGKNYEIVSNIYEDKTKNTRKGV